MARRSLPSTLIAWLALGCHSSSGAGDAPTTDIARPADVTPWRPDAIVTMVVTTSWIDRGEKAIVLDNREAYACRATSCRKFSVAERERAELLRAFVDHSFLDLRDMHARLTDGADVRITIADTRRAHTVVDYMSPNKDFDAIRESFAHVVESHFDKGESVTRAAMSEALGKNSSTSQGDPRGREVDAWLRLVMTDLE
jgi:hypothetical protein